MHLMHTFLPALTLSPFLLLGSLAAQNQQTTIVPSKDNTLYQDAAGGLSNGAGTRMFAGNTGVQTMGLTRRALLSFDVAAAIPAGSTIVSASLTLTVVQAISGGQATTLHPVLASWGEGTSMASVMGQGGGAPATPNDATWVHRFFSTQNWTNAGGDFAATASGTATVAGLGPYTWTSTAQMVADVQGWLDNPSGNFGWMVRTTETGTNTAKAFATREHGIPAERPQLAITWRPPAAAVVPTGTGCSGGGPAPLTIAAVGLPQVPNPNFAITMTGGPTGGIRALGFAFDLSPVPIPLGGGCFLYLNPLTLALTLTVAPPNVPLPIPNDPSFFGIGLPIQGIALDPSPALATSNALTLRFGS
jgi:hypothetical protein